MSASDVYSDCTSVSESNVESAVNPSNSNSETNTEQPYWILALDGGGVRFVIELVWLRRIFERFPTMEKRFRLVAGTSAGALVAGAMATKGFAETYRLMMQPDFMKKVFTDSYAHDVYALNGWRAAMYSNSALAAIADEYYTMNDRIGDWPKQSDQPHLLITSFCVDRAAYAPSTTTPMELRDLDTNAESSEALQMESDLRVDTESSQIPSREWCPRIYHTFNWLEGHGHMPIRDVWLQTTAAPTYFPSHLGCVDGGVCANCPAMIALTTARHYKQFDSLDTVRVLSLGTGVWPSNMNDYGPSADLGKMQWLPHLVSLTIDSSAEMAVINCRQLLGETGFHRVQICLPRYVALHDYAAFEELQQWAEDYDLSETFAWIANNTQR